MLGSIFGKRPDVLEYPGDVGRLGRQGATSFHVSEERWEDALILKPGMTKKELDANRKGWDLLIDIDTAYWYGATQAAYFIIEALKYHDIKNYSIKFSVTGNTPILIQNKGETKLMPIKEAIKLFKSKEKISCLSIDKNHKLTFSKIYDYTMHRDQIFHLYHKLSKIPLEVTKHHSVFCWEKSLIKEKKVSELKKGDFLISFETSSNPFNKKIKEINFTYEFKKKKIKEKIKITPEFLRLIGYYLAEGHNTKSINQLGFSFNIKEKDYIEDCKKLIRHLDKNVNICERNPNKGTLQILAHSKRLSSLFQQLCKDKKEKHVPNFIWKLGKKEFLELLTGYIRGDGYKLGEYHIAIKSVCRQLITEVLWLCKLNGMSCRIYTEKNKPHKLPQGIMFKGSYCYRLDIPRSELNPEFFRKRNKFSPYPGSKIYPTDGLKEIYKQCKPKKFLTHRNEHITLKKKRANAERIKKVIEWFEKYCSIKLNSKSKEILSNYKKIIKSDINVIPVTKIIPKKRKLVYDVSVEKTESFFGNNYPLLLHNSGNKGFHIGVPFETFPDEVHGIKTKDLFPDSLRVIAAYIQDFIKDYLAAKLLEKDSISEIAKICNKTVEELKKDDLFDPFTVIEIDTVLISNRHLFRAPYSLHEKSGLVSLPINPEDLLTFEKEMANPKKIKTDIKFLDASKVIDDEARSLVIQAFDWYSRKNRSFAEQVVKKQVKEVELPKIALQEETFPPCIKKILEGKMEDGKKRALFVLIKFLRHMGWSWEALENRIREWNESNLEPLRENYVMGQINYARRNKSNAMAPNCSNVSYYKDLGICFKMPLCDKIKNPVNFAKIRAKNNKNIIKKTKGTS